MGCAPLPYPPPSQPSAPEAGLAAFSAAATEGAIDPSGYAPIRALLLGLNPRLGARSPVHVLRHFADRHIFRIINE